MTEQTPLKITHGEQAEKPADPAAIEGTWTDVERHARYVYWLETATSSEHELAEAVLVLLRATGSAADFVNALDLHKQRIRKLQEALCECQHRDFFQADLHDETCPVYVIATTKAVA